MRHRTTKSPSLNAASCFALIGVAMLLCGCGNDQLDTTPPAAATSDDSKQPTDLAVQRARIQDLEAQITQAQAARDAAQLNQTRVQAQLEDHQRTSGELLASYKKRLAAQRDPTANDRLAEQARNELEHALALDQEYLTQLEHANVQLSATDSQLSELRATLKKLNTR